MSEARNEIVQVSFRTTEQEYLAAVRFYFWKSRELLLRLVVFYVLLSAGVLLLFQLLDFLLPIWFTLSIIGLVGLAIFHGTVTDLPRRYFRGDPRFRDEFHLTFSDSGIQFQTQSINSSLAWSLYSSVIENDNFYILIYGRDIHALSVIPKRAFSDSRQEMVFRELLRRHLDHTLPLKSSEREQSEYLPPPSGPPDWR